MMPSQCCHALRPLHRPLIAPRVVRACGSAHIRERKFSGSTSMDRVQPSNQHAENERQILDTIEVFLARDVAPYVHALEKADTYPAEIVERMKELGLFGATIAAEYGGLGLPCGIYAQIV